MMMMRRRELRVGKFATNNSRERGVESFQVKAEEDKD